MAIDTPDTTCYLPSNAKLWTINSYTDLVQWYSLNKPESLVPVQFPDESYFFLEEQEPPPQKSEGALWTRRWARNGCEVIVEDGTKAYVTLNHRTISYDAPQKWPLIPKAWQPAVCLMNENIYAVRILNDIALLFSKADSEEDFKVFPVQYSQGFCCVHPITKQAFFHGSFAISNFTLDEEGNQANLSDLFSGDLGERHVVKLYNKINNRNKRMKAFVIPFFHSESGSWGFFLQFYEWGCLMLPRRVIVEKNASPLCGRNLSSWNTIGYVFISPNILVKINIVLKSPGQLSLTHGTNFMVTCIKQKATEIVIFVVINRQLCSYTFSYKHTINNEQKPCVIYDANFKLRKLREDTDDSSCMIQTSARVKVHVVSSGPIDCSHLLNWQVICVFDVAAGQFYSNRHALELSDVFIKTVADSDSPSRTERHLNMYSDACLEESP